jgi:hypothetical protein
MADRGVNLLDERFWQRLGQMQSFFSSLKTERQLAKNIEPGRKPKLTSSTKSNASTMLNAGSQQSAA